MKSFTLEIEFREIPLTVSGEWEPSSPAWRDRHGDWMPPDPTEIIVQEILHKGESVLELFSTEMLEKLIDKLEQGLES